MLPISDAKFRPGRCNALRLRVLHACSGQKEVSFRAQDILFYFDLVARPTEGLQRNPVRAGVFLVA
jgi:hypothetical protein